jgi:hypothetical protein
MQNVEIIGKRINLEAGNLKKLKIIAMLFTDETFGMNEKKKLDFVVNQAISEYYSSNEIKELLPI